ncbi:MAG: hemerythrin family protein, partial [Rhodospirillaceae bacterium]
LDTQHQGIIDALKRLSESIVDGRTWDAAVALSGEVIERFEQHFFTEETYMRSIRYPGVGLHVVAHSGFFSDISGLIYRIETHDDGVIGDLVACMKSWAYDHVEGMDRDIARFAAERG